MTYSSKNNNSGQSTSLEEILSLMESKTGYQPRRCGNGYMARCPVHDDKSPSLSISEGDGGKILLHCHAGCNYTAIRSAMDLNTTSPFQQPQIYLANPATKPTKTATYPYINKDGQLICWKQRFEPGFEGKDKSFIWQQYGKDGRPINNRTGCEKILYRLPEILTGIEKNEMIFLVEGEKDADILLKNMLIAGTAPETTEWNEGFTNTLKNANVVLLYDNDKAGLKRKDLITNSLYGKVKKLRVINLPGIEYSESHGKDVSDWLAMGNTIDQLLELAARTPEYVPQTTQEEKPNTNFTSLGGLLRAMTIDELFTLELPQRKMLLAPFLPTQGLVLLVAKRGVGKTHIALGIAYAVASGGTFLRWTAPEPKKVLYIDGEMPAVLMQERLYKVAAMSNKKHITDFFVLLTPDVQENPMPDFSCKEGRDSIEPLLDGVDLVVIDNISCLFRSGSENESESWQEAQEWALNLRRKGKSILFVHHAGKNGVQRGTSKREDILDTVIMLKHLDDYKSEQGACFEIKFDKARHFSGEDASSFQVQLKETAGRWCWEISNDPEEERIRKVATMKASGYTIQAIVDQMKITKSQVETLTIKAKTRGLLI